MTPVSTLLAEAQEAFLKYQASCFWFMDPALTVTTENLPRILAGLRTHGDRKAFILAQRLSSRWKAMTAEVQEDAPPKTTFRH